MRERGHGVGRTVEDAYAGIHRAYPYIAEAVLEQGRGFVRADVRVGSHIAHRLRLVGSHADSARARGGKPYIALAVFDYRIHIAELRHIGVAQSGRDKRLCRAVEFLNTVAGTHPQIVTAVFHYREYRIAQQRARFGRTRVHHCLGAVEARKAIVGSQPYIAEVVLAYFIDVRIGDSVEPPGEVMKTCVAARLGQKST